MIVNNDVAADKANLLPLDKCPINLDDPELYVNRELSWLKFNWRVLNEADDPRTPLLDRVKFLSIVSSNLDEFCMKRIGGLHLQIAAEHSKKTIDGRTPSEQVALCAKEIADLGQAKEKIYKTVMAELKGHKVTLLKYGELSRAAKEAMRDFYKRNVHPLITPQAIDSHHPFPFISNLSLNLFVSMTTRKNKKPVYVRVKVPTDCGLPRFVKIDSRGSPLKTEYVSLEDIMINNLDILFPNVEIRSCDVFRLTRNANSLADHSDAADLIETIQAYLRDRKFAPVVRVQFSPSMKQETRQILQNWLGVDVHRAVIVDSHMPGMRDLMQISAIDRPTLRTPPHLPVKNVLLAGDGDIFSQIQQHGPILLQHPYECFTASVERFVESASLDNQVQAIKMTIYRTSTDSKIINHLIRAARNGKHVAVVVELTASFDEQANIEWAERLEHAGIHVSYGIPGLKTHSKVILVVRRNGSKLNRFVHVSTGNYHARNATIYSDFGLLTCDPELAHDVSELFNYLTTGCSPSRDYNQLLTAPRYIKKVLLEKIEREALHAKGGQKAHIRFKCNAVEDPDIVRALYQASIAGVKIDLVVRDICRLRPGITGLSDTINVTSIVGQFLEHGRIYHFHNCGDDEYFIGSADLMTRNLERRVEILAPIKDVSIKAQLCWVLDSQLTDQRCAWKMEPDGTYVQQQPNEAHPPNDLSGKGSQSAAIERVKIIYTIPKDLKEVSHG